jgi:hypothetical protein
MLIICFILSVCDISFFIRADHDNSWDNSWCEKTSSACTSVKLTLGVCIRIKLPSLEASPPEHLVHALCRDYHAGLVEDVVLERKAFSQVPRACLPTSAGGIRLE